MSERIERKCRSCGTWNEFADLRDATACPKCGKPYGRIEIGLDRIRKGKSK